MESINTCPDCGENLDIIKLGSEPIREVCGRFGCQHPGRTVSESEARQIVA